MIVFTTRLVCSCNGCCCCCIYAPFAYPYIFQIAWRNFLQVWSWWVSIWFYVIKPKIKLGTRYRVNCDENRLCSTFHIEKYALLWLIYICYVYHQFQPINFEYFEMFSYFMIHMLILKITTAIQCAFVHNFETFPPPKRSLASGWMWNAHTTQLTTK